MTPGRRPGARLSVLLSFPRLDATTNPYNKQLVASLAPHVDALLFTWRRALGGQYDVLHVHWPERLLRGRTRATGYARLLLFLTLMITTRLRRQAVVRTVHNLEPHERVAAAERFALAVLDRRTSLFIRLNPQTPTRPGTPTRTILHGHYRDWVPPTAGPRAEPVPGRLLFFGNIRRYKGLDSLLDAFSQLADPAATLHIAGLVGDDVSAARLAAALAADHRVTARTAFVPEPDLVAEIAASQLVVLPYRSLHNSGAALLALSLDRPVLVPANEVTRDLADEVGATWVLRFDAPLDSAALERALRCSAALPSRPPDLTRRGWVEAGLDHATVYADAVGSLRPRPVRRRHRDDRFSSLAP